MGSNLVRFSKLKLKLSDPLDKFRKTSKAKSLMKQRSFCCFRCELHSEDTDSIQRQL